MESMGFFKGLINRFNTGDNALSSLYSFFSPYKNWEYSPTHLTDPYSQTAIVYAVINRISMTVQSLPIVWYQGTRGDDQNKKPIKTFRADQKAISDLINYPNTIQRGQFHRIVMSYLDLYGEAPIFLHKTTEQSAITMLEILNPVSLQEQTQTSPDGRIMLTGWQYGNLKIEPWNLINIRYFNHSNPFRGLSPLDPAGIPLRESFYADQFNEAFFRNGCDPGGVLIAKNLGDTARKLLEKSFEDRHLGPTNAKRNLIIEGDGDYKPLPVNNRDMEYARLKETSVNEVCMVFNIHPDIIKPSSAAKLFDDRSIIAKSYWEDCIIPRCRLIEDQLYYGLFEKTVGIWFEYDLSGVKALQDDFDKQVTIAIKLQQLGYTLNQINQKLNLGMDDVEWGDENPGAFNLDLLQPAAPADGTPTPADNAAKLALANQNNDNKQIVRKSFTKAQKSAIFEEFKQLQEPLEAKFKSKVSRFFFEQRNKVLKRLNADIDGKSFAKFSHNLINDDEEIALLRKYLEPLYELGLKAGATSTAKRVSDVGFVFSPLDERFQRWSNKRLKEILPNIVANSKRIIMKNVSEGIANGESIDQIAKRVRESYNMVAKRSFTIARTESASMINAGRYEYMNGSPDIANHVWVTAGDEAVRAEHQIDGEVVQVGSKFSNGLLFPNDPSGEAWNVINCRCTTVPEENNE